MQQEPTLALRQKKKTRTVEKDEYGEVDPLQTTGSPQGSMLSRNIPSVTSTYSHDSEMITRILDDTVSESDYSTPETEANVIHHSMQVMESMYVNLLEIYDGIPDIDEISEDVESRKSVPIKEDATRPSDEGVFVDPLTGEILPKSAERVSITAESEVEEIPDGEGEEETESSEELQPELSISEDSEMLQLLEFEKAEEVLTKEAIQVDELDDFLLKETIPIEEKPNLAALRAEQLERERIYKILLTETETFLQTIIDEVIEYVEYKQPIELLRNNLDKRALMNEISTKINELEVERTIRGILNRKAVEFYKRKGLYLAITDDSPDQIMENIDKLNYATTQLDQAIGLEHTMKMKAELQQNELKVKLSQMQEMAQQKEEEFKTLVLNTLVKNKGNSLRTISGLLNEMFTTYDEVCQTYFKLIQIQHTKTELQKENDYIEFGQGLQQYVILQTEAKDLHKKVEDRSVELDIVRARCNRDIHAFSNVKLKSDIARIVNGMKKKTLACLVADRKESRAKLVHLKEERLHLQKQIRELTFQTGLLSNPPLLRDYDNTVEQMEKTSQHIAALRKQKKVLVATINKIEAQCKAREILG
uniref:Coiled-coil domain-containing protein 96 n=1 Tax=Zeugodacus cucurbitae TaxID=28588 RepID=A0A0A1XAG8_ZEUCU